MCGSIHIPADILMKKAFTLECLQAKGRANATKGCFYEWGSCGFILLQRFMHLGAMLHCLNGAFLL